MRKESEFRLRAALPKILGKHVAAIAAGLVSLLGFASVAIAQEAPTPPSVISPLKSIQDPNGVNLTDGMKNVDMPVVLSTPADPRLSFDRVQSAEPYIVGTFPSNCTAEGCTYQTSSWSAHLGAGTSESFQCVNDDVCHNVKYDGSTLIYRGSSIGSDVRQAGTAAYFKFDQKEENYQSPDGGGIQLQYYASSVTYPDGEAISYSYDQGFLAGDCCNRTFQRPTKVSSNTGYYISIIYQDETDSDASNPAWAEPAQAALYSPSGSLIRRIVYNSDGTIVDYGNNATNTGGRTFTTTGIANATSADLETLAASIKLPEENDSELSVTRGTFNNLGLIAAVAHDGVTWNYNYTNVRALSPGGNLFVAYDSVTVAGPDGYNVTYAMEPASYFGTTDPSRNVVKSQTDALGRTTIFAYDPTRNDLLTGVTFPEGNSVSVVYGGCGDIVTRTTTEKPSAGSASLTESATYDSNPLCPVTSYRPTSYTDALGRVTSYAYDSTTGQMTKELDPADASGHQRLTVITYANSAAGISRKTLEQVCQSSTAVIDTAGCSGNALSHTQYTYLGDTNLPVTITQKDEATGAARTTTYAYDAAGRPTMVDGPLTGTDDAKYIQYDGFGREVWEVAELAPNGLRLAKKYTYRDSDDKVTKVETGTVACTSACDTASLSLTLLQQSDTDYDSRRNAIRDTTSKSGTVYSVTDRSFLDRGLAECTTVRMNFASLPAEADHGACALGAQGSQGPDRITKNNYDSAGQLLKVQKAFGVTGLQQDYVTYTYTPNGKQQTITDANGNKAQFVYDGFDRLFEWQFPSKTTPGAVDTADFEQYAYDDAGNRTCLRKRDGSKLTYTFDALNRMTSKVVAATSGGSCP